MRYHNITHDDMLNGDGLRVVLWVAGCSHRCKDCQNPITWDPNGGIEFCQKEIEEIFDYMSKDYISGITYSGGDPLYIDNREDITNLAKVLRDRFPDKTQWLYTGYWYDDVKDLEVMKYIDVIVDGPFINTLKDNTLHWKGSSNQRVIDVQKSRELGTIVLHS